MSFGLKRRGESTYPFSNLFDGAVTICRSEEVLAEEDEFGLAVLEADETVLPVPDVVPEAHVQDQVAQVVAVEVEPECIHDAVPLVYHNQYSWCIAATAHGGTLGLQSRVGVGMPRARSACECVFRCVGYVFLAA